MAVAVKKTQNLFAAAKPAAKPVAKSNSKVDNRVTVVGVAALAGACLLEKAVQGVIKTYKADVHVTMGELFVDQVKVTKTKPKSFKGVEDQATADLQFRRRTSLSPLDQAAKDLLDEHKLPYEEVVEVEEGFLLNPVHAADAKKMAQINKALLSMKDCPLDLFVKQERKFKYIVTDETIEAAAKDADVFAEVMSVIGTLAVKPTTKEKLVDVIDRLRDELIKQEEAE